MSEYTEKCTGCKGSGCKGCHGTGRVPTARAADLVNLIRYVFHEIMDTPIRADLTTPPTLHPNLHEHKESTLPRVTEAQLTKYTKEWLDAEDNGSKWETKEGHPSVSGEVGGSGKGSTGPS